MWTQHRINTEKLYFLTREKNNMDTEVKNILAVYMVLGKNPPCKKAPQTLNLTLSLT